MTTVGRFRSAAARGLPHPVARRFKPLRAGILDVWEYDRQEFWFADGRLILRGQNTSGKSKALVLLLPFVLDGETRAERLDPFGNRSKTMYWNLIDFDPERRSAVGYCWLEFGRVDDAGAEEYVTLIAGLRATRNAGRSVTTWFAVTPRRVGVDLDLTADGRALTAERLRAALDGQGHVHDHARDHRAAVDQALFGLGPDRYDALIHLLLQLRRPKLSEKLDLSKLTGLLTDALPPLDRGRMELLASAFARLDAESAGLEALEAAHAELCGFLDHYRAYAMLQVRLRADRVRSANSRFDKVTETERFERAERDEASAHLESTEARQREVAALEDQLRGQLAGIDLTKVHALAEVERRAAEREREAGSHVQRAQADADAANAAQAETARLRADAEAAWARQAEVDDQAATAAEAAGLAAAHDIHRPGIPTDPDTAEPALDGHAARQARALHEVRTAERASSRARAAIDRADERHRDAQDAAAQAEAEAVTAAEAALAAEAAFAADVDDWASSLPAEVGARLAVPADGGHGLGQAALARVAGAARPDVAATQVAADALEHARTWLRSERATAELARAATAAERDELQARHAAIAAETDDAPPPGAGRPPQRPAGTAPLWACTDFAASLDPAERAGIEAALHAAGILDALVTPGGRLVDADTLDTVLGGEAAPGPNLSRWLVPACDGPLPAAPVSTALARIGAGADSPAACWVAPDGRWANGPLTGRWHGPSADYVGASSRAAARARRMAELEERIETLVAQLAGLEAKVDTLAGLQAEVDTAAGTFPSPAPLQVAALNAQRAAATAVSKRQALVTAAQQMTAAQAAGEAAFHALAAAEATAGCQADGVDSRLEAVADYRRVVAVLAGTAREGRRATAAADAAAARSVGLASRAEASRQEADAATRRARQARAEAEELRRNTGADVTAILARQQQLETALAAAGEEQRSLALRRDDARDRLARAQTRLESTEEERRQREGERAEALLALARVAATELAPLAVGAVDTDRDLTQVTAGLAFARSAFERLRDVAVDQAAHDAAVNRLHSAYTALRSRLGADFDPHLDTSDGLNLCVARLQGEVTGAVDLEVALATQIERRRAHLSAEERDLIERHLLTEVGSHLGERAHAAWSLVQRMNDQLAAHPTRSGVTLRLSWEPHPDAGPQATEALRLLRREVSLLDATERATLAGFLAERVRAGREDADGGDTIERLAGALDYRRWHRFVVHRRDSTGAMQFTARAQAVGSGGEQAKLAHLPLFAAVAGYYASALPTAPRLLVLDEAFAGIDDDQRADCMGMLVELDLDSVLANYDEWGCYAEVPAVAVYHLERAPGRMGVAALRFVWDGSELTEDDPFLAQQAQAPTGVFTTAP